MAKGKLTLIPTPLSLELPLEPVASALLQLASSNAHENIVVVEELKPARARWTQWGLPREQLNAFLTLNEHNAILQSQYLLEQLNQGKNIFLLSDGGLPAFMDPGTQLIDLCHTHNIVVTSTPFPHSVALALALSGFVIEEYHFYGFLPTDKDLRAKKISAMAKDSNLMVVMDTPYRLQRLLSELALAMGERRAFLAMELNSQSEQLKRQTLRQLNEECASLGKKEFILVIEGQEKK